MLECFLLAEELFSVHHKLLISIAYVESSFHPYAFNIRSSGKIDTLLKGIPYRRSSFGSYHMYSVYPETYEDAVYTLKVALKYAKDFDVGIMQVNVRNVSFLEKEGVIGNITDLLDPCKNVLSGALIMKRCIDRFGYSPRAIDCYNRGEGKAKELSAYVLKVGEVLDIIMEVE